MKKLLFICLGNICRSPVAEAIMTEYITRQGMEKEISCDSAGILDYHEGEPADRRMKSHARRRGYDLTSISRPVKKADFDHFDMIIAMDRQNIRDLKSIARNEGDLKKIFLVTDFMKIKKYDSVPDPYYGGEEGFETVIDILEEACSDLLNHLRNGEVRL